MDSIITIENEIAEIYHLYKINSLLESEKTEKIKSFYMKNERRINPITYKAIELISLLEMIISNKNIIEKMDNEFFIQLILDYQLLIHKPLLSLEVVKKITNILNNNIKVENSKIFYLVSNDLKNYKEISDEDVGILIKNTGNHINEIKITEATFKHCLANTLDVSGIMCYELKSMEEVRLLNERLRSLDFREKALEYLYTQHIVTPTALLIYLIMKPKQALEFRNINPDTISKFLCTNHFQWKADKNNDYCQYIYEDFKNIKNITAKELFYIYLTSKAILSEKDAFEIVNNFLELNFLQIFCDKPKTYGLLGKKHILEEIIKLEDKKNFSVIFEEYIDKFIKYGIKPKNKKHVAYYESIEKILTYCKENIKNLNTENKIENNFVNTTTFFLDENKKNEDDNNSSNKNNFLCKKEKALVMETIKKSNNTLKKTKPIFLEEIPMSKIEKTDSDVKKIKICKLPLLPNKIKKNLNAYKFLNDQHLLILLNYYVMNYEINEIIDIYLECSISNSLIDDFIKRNIQNIKKPLEKLLACSKLRINIDYNDDINNLSKKDLNILIKKCDSILIFKSLFCNSNINPLNTSKEAIKKLYNETTDHSELILSINNSTETFFITYLKLLFDQYEFSYIFEIIFHVLKCCSCSVVLFIQNYIINEILEDGFFQEVYFDQIQKIYNFFISKFKNNCCEVDTQIKIHNEMILGKICIYAKIFKKDIAIGNLKLI